VLMTAYNRADFIGTAIESVLASDFEDFELIVVDDGSKDATVDIANEYAAMDTRVQIYRNPQNLGDYPNRNRAASLASGHYLKYVDSDDAIYPWGLSTMVRCMDRFPESGYGLSARSEYDRPHPVLFTPYEAYREEFFGRELFGRAPGSAIIRRTAFEAVGGFSGSRDTGDYELWHKIGARYCLVSLPPALLWDRVHPGQESNNHNEIERAVRKADVVRTALDDLHCPLSVWEKKIARKAFRQKYRHLVWRYLLRHGRLSEAWLIHKSTQI
jgi:glycosyltransferase involved in cell wall biosynthesis